MRRPHLSIPLVGLLLCLTTFAHAEGEILKQVWSFENKAGVYGPPVPIMRNGQADGVLVTLPAGKLLVLDAYGKTVRTINIGVTPSCVAQVADLDGNGTPYFIVVDGYGSIYCFDQLGHRRWKYARRSRSGDFRVIVCSDLLGTGKQDILFSDGRGYTLCLDGKGHLLLEIHATAYRSSAPAVGDVDGDGRSEIAFGTEGHDVFCMRSNGDLFWAAKLDCPVGRCLPVIVNLGARRKSVVLVPTSFVTAHPGLYAYSGKTGAEVWKAPCNLQTYQATAVADIEGNGKQEVLFGDKNTRLFCVDADGKRRWMVQPDGGGIFFCPAVAWLPQSKQSLIFLACRPGNSGKSLYVLHSDGTIVDSYPLPGGGEDSPVLCRFRGSKAMTLLTDSGGKLTAFQLAPGLGQAKILWSGPGNCVGKAVAAAQSGRGHKASQPEGAAPARPEQALAGAERCAARMGTNLLPVTVGAPNGVVCVRVQEPGGLIRSKVMRVGPGEQEPDYSFAVSNYGAYNVSVRWLSPTTSRDLKARRFVYTLSKDLSVDAAELARFQNELRSLAHRAPENADLLDYVRVAATAAWNHARDKHSAKLFDEARRDRDTAIALATCCAHHHPGSGIMVNQLRNPWSEFDAVSALREAAHTTAGVRARMLGNAAESVALAVTNLQPSAVTMRLVCSDFKSAKGVETAARRLVQFREVLRVLPSTPFKPIEDPLPLLGEAQTLNFGPGETRKVWLTFRSRDLAAGDYHATLKVGDLTTFDAPVETPVSLHVYPLRVPDQLTYHHHNWLYATSYKDEEQREAMLADALDHHTNSFCIPGCSVRVDKEGHPIGADCDLHDQYVNKLKGKAILIINGSVGVSWPQGFTPDKALADRAFSEALRWYGAHMTSLGVGYDQYAFYMMDEPGLHGDDAQFAEFVASVKRVKAADPRLQVFVDPAGGATADLLKRVDGLVDIWVPDLHLVRGQPKELGVIFKHAKYFWNYEAVAEQRSMNPLGYYRMKPWVAFQLGMNGGGWWVYDGWADWWTWDPGHGEYGSIYETDKGPVTTKRWEAAREGIEDYELLLMVRNAAERDTSPKGAAALNLLDEAVAFVTKGQEHVSDLSRQVWPYTPDFDRWMAYRDRLIQTAIELTH